MECISIEVLSRVDYTFWLLVNEHYRDVFGNYAGAPGLALLETWEPIPSTQLRSALYR